MLEKLLLVQKRINGEEAETFKTKWFGKYLTGDVTLVFGDDAYTLSFHKGTLIEVYKGIPLTGFDMGLSGTQEGWKEVYKHQIFQKAISNIGTLKLLGASLRVRSNLNPLAHLVRVLCKVV